MRPCVKILLLCGVALLAVMLFVDHSVEPRYNDIPLSKWIALHQAHQLRRLPFLQSSQAPEDPREREAEEAIRHMGPQALPLLVKWIDARPSPWKHTLAKQIVGRRGAPRGSFADRLLVLLDPWKDQKRRVTAYNAFVILGSAAIPAIPDLVNIASNSRSPGSDQAANVLVGLGTPGVSALLYVLRSNESVRQRIRVMNGLGWIGPGAASAVTAIIPYLKDPDMELAAASATALGRIREHPDLAVPALIAALDDPRYLVRQSAAKALGEFGAVARQVVPKLISLLATPDYVFGQAVERTLQQVGPEDMTNATGRDASLFNPSPASSVFFFTR